MPDDLYEPGDECTYGRSITLDGQEYTLWFDDDDGRPGWVTEDDGTELLTIWGRGEPLNETAQSVMQGLGFTETSSWHDEPPADTIDQRIKWDLRNRRRGTD